MTSPGDRSLEEGWYLMSVADLEIELARIRDPDRSVGSSNAKPLRIEEALAFRDNGNVPDERDRTLRLVLRTGEEPLSEKRARYEPDYHRHPDWRREGSKPINIVPLPSRDTRGRAGSREPWWDQPDVAALERQWRETGAVAGLAIPAAYRGFLLKTISSLQAAGIDVTIDTVTASLARWLSPEQVAEIREALLEANG